VFLAVLYFAKMRFSLLCLLLICLPGTLAFTSCNIHSISNGMKHQGWSRRSHGTFSSLQRFHTDRKSQLPVRMCTNGDNLNQGTEVNDSGSPGPLRKYGLLGFWISFILYGIFVAPTGDSEIQQTMLKALFAPPPWDGVNPIFASLFMLLGVWPAVFAGLLFPLKPTSQTLPTWPFITASFGLGAFGLTPYLALTSYAPGPTDSESGAARFFGSTAMGALLLTSTVGLLLFALGVFAPNDLNGGSDYPVDVIFYTYSKNFLELFRQYKLVHLPSCDFLALWALSATPLLEDMRRRGWYRGGAFDTALYASFMLAPLVGACAWLAVRPPLPAPPRAPADAPAPEP
jgi:hypothetical protein